MTPVNFYAQSVTVQQSGTLSAVFAGTRKAVTLTIFDVKSTAVSGTGAALPPALQSGQDNTQVGAGVSYSQQLFYQTNFTSSLTYSRTTANNTEGLFANTRSNNASGTVGLSGPIGPKTSWSTSVNYSRTDFTAGQTGNTSAFNVTATISHTFF